jgi:hypothetical protein
MGYRTPEVGVGVATWAIRWEWAMTHWRESANLMWRNLEHVTGAYSEHAKKKRYEHRREAWGDAHRAAGTHRENDTSRKRPQDAAASERGERRFCDSYLLTVGLVVAAAHCGPCSSGSGVCVCVYLFGG